MGRDGGEERGEVKDKRKREGRKESEDKRIGQRWRIKEQKIRGTGRRREKGVKREEKGSRENGREKG